MATTHAGPQGGHPTPRPASRTSRCSEADASGHEGPPAPIRVPEVGGALYRRAHAQAADMAIAPFFGGCYDASRTAALSGVPKSTVYDWARKGVIVPSVSADQEKLWSYADLMALRIVYWLRHKKEASGDEIPASPMPQVRAALMALASQGMAVWSEADDISPLVVEESGKVLIRQGDVVHDVVTGATSLPDPLHSFGLTEPFGIGGHGGPDLIKPRPHLRMLPGKVAGEPHVVGTRITSSALASLIFEGYGRQQVASMYGVSAEVVDEAQDLEKQLGLFARAA